MIRALACSALLTPLLAAAPYTADDESLSAHTAAPEWFQDAKLGIYFHWGPYSVPAYHNEWYPFYMNRPGHKVFQHHVENYGHPKDVGYHEFVKDFTGENFDAAEWAQLFKAAGARFAGPVAEHHDGFSMWDSDVTPWNAADRGPKQDILGNLFAELRKREVKTLATFHHARQLQRYPAEEAPADDTDRFQSKEKFRFDSHYTNWKGWPTSSDDPELQFLYGNMPEAKWVDEVWQGKLSEVTEKYQPDIIWFDAWLDSVPEPARLKFAANYLNAAKEWQREVVIVRKNEDMPLSYSVNDHEKSREPKAAELPWMTDDTISYGSWCYTEGMKVKPLSEIVHALIDTVSKNGVTLLNIAPKANGEIPQEQRDALTGLGEWLETNGEGIYETRPWATFGEGPTKEPEGGFSNHQKFQNLKYSSADVRYTRSKDGKTVYAFFLGQPDEGERVLTAFTTTEIGTVPSVKSVTKLGDDESSFDYKLSDEGLEIELSELNKTPALGLKIELE